jgi:hypothetical protein
MYVCTAGQKNCERFDAALEKARTDLDAVKASYGEKSQIYIKAKAAVDAYGKKDEKNGVTIQLGILPKGSGAKHNVANVKSAITKENKNGQDIRITLDQNGFDRSDLRNTIVHEGSHISDSSKWVSCNFCNKNNPTVYETEEKAYLVEAAFMQIDNKNVTVWFEPNQVNRGPKTPTIIPYFRQWDESWKTVDNAQPEIEFFLKNSKLYKKYNEKAF